VDALDVLRTLDRYLALVMDEGAGKTGLAFAVDTTRPDTELAAICQRLERALGMISESYAYAESLANGDLRVGCSRGNVFAMPLKALQASLSHLTWQATRVADGDLGQEVHFLGEFSASFNHMIRSLREKRALEARLQTITDVLGEGSTWSTPTAA
jgi:hypothetical protein